MNKLNDVKIQEFIKNFNEDFKCNIPEDTTTFLVDLYANFISLNTSGSETHKEYLQKVIDIEDKIMPKFNEEQQVLLKEYIDAEEDMWSDSVEQAFTYGYCIWELLHKYNNTSSN